MSAALIPRLGRDRRGAVFVELAVGMAVLVPMLLMGVELGRFALIQQKLERLATTVADLNTRADVTTAGQVDAIFAAVPHVMEPFSFAGGAVVVTGVTATSGGIAQVAWQRRGGTGTAPSRVGTVGNPAALPAGLTVAPNESVVVAEVFYDYQPFLLSLVDGQWLYDRAILRPRLSDQPIVQ